jgi:glycine cleavage system transcriptional repressor
LNKGVVITGVGRDRVGIVAELTDALFSLGCNLLDSSMTLLRGEFAIILMMTIPETLPLADLQNHLEKVQKRLGFALHLRELAEDEMQIVEENSSGYIISVYGADKPGIVSGVTRRLSEMGANITDVETKRSSPSVVAVGGSAPAKPIFLMVLEVTAPVELKTDYLQKEMKELAHSLGVDISIQEWDVLEL